MSVEAARSETRGATAAPDPREARRLWSASEELEGLFVTQLVKASRMAAGSVFGNVPGGGVLQGLAEEALGKALAESADFGVASGLFRDLAHGAPRPENSRAAEPGAPRSPRPPRTELPVRAATPARPGNAPPTAARRGDARSNDAQPSDGQPSDAQPAGDERPSKTANGAGSTGLLDRLAPFGNAIAEAAERFGIDPDLIRAVIARESGGDPAARSPKGARGLMQIVPATGRALGLSQPFDPRENILAGTRYLAQMLERHGGDVPLALAAYNAGPGAVARHGGIPPFGETLRYVSDVLGLADALRGSRSDEVGR